MANIETHAIKDLDLLAVWLERVREIKEMYYVIAKVELNTGRRISDILPCV